MWKCTTYAAEAPPAHLPGLSLQAACWYTRPSTRQLDDELSRLEPGCGVVAQLGERLVRNEEVSGSIPLNSTMLRLYARSISLAADHA